MPPKRSKTANKSQPKEINTAKPSQSKGQSSAKVSRAKRQCNVKTPEQSQSYQNEERWSLEEKKAFLAALKLHGQDDVQKIQKYLPDRSIYNITKTIKRYRNSSKSHHEQKRRMRAPIEFWHCQAEFLTENLYDVSAVLANVMSIAGHLEAHSTPTNQGDLDYSAIYAYLSELLKGQEPRKLEASEARVVLSLFHDMANHLHSMDFSRQNKLMMKKFRALSQPVDFIHSDASRTSFVNIMRALQEDLPDDKTLGTATSSAACSGDNQSHQQKNSSKPNNRSETDQSETVSQSSSSQLEATSQSPSNQSDKTSQSQGNQSQDRAEPASSQSDTTQEELQLPQHAPLYSLNPFCIPLKYLQPAARYTRRIVAPQSQTVSLHKKVITEAMQKGLLKPGDKVKLKVMQKEGNKHQVILTKTKTPTAETSTEKGCTSAGVVTETTVNDCDAL